MKPVKKLSVRRSARLRTKLRKRVNGRPRLSVFRSSRHIYAQVIDDSSGKIKTFRGKNSKIAPGVRVIGCTARRALSKRGHVKLVKLKGNKLEKG